MGLQFRQVRVHDPSWCKSMTADRPSLRSRKLKAHFSNHKWEAKGELGRVYGLDTPKFATRDMLSVARLNLLNLLGLPKWRHRLGFKYSNIGAYVGDSHSDHHTADPASFFVLFETRFSCPCHQELGFQVCASLPGLCHFQLWFST